MRLYRAYICVPVYVYKHMLRCECAHSLVYMCICMWAYLDMCVSACLLCVHIHVDGCVFMCLHMHVYMCVCMYSSQKTNVIPVNKWNRTNKVWVERTWEQMRVKYSETWWDDYLPGIMALFTNHKSLMVLKNFAMSFICTGFSYTISMYLQGTNQLSNFAQIQWVKILTPSCSYVLERLFLTTIYDQTDLI